MAAKRISKSAIDWAAFAKRVPENQKPMYLQFKAKSDGYLRRVLAQPESMPALDWAYYSSRVSAPGMVDQFKKQLAALSIPYPEDKGVSSQIDAQAKEAEKKVTQFVSESKARIAGYEAELAKWEVVPAFDQMTMEEFRDHFPDLALDPVNRPTFWPHTPEAQQPDEPAAH
ncbi:ATP synthase subunit d, mitochondrial-like [Amphibalanus amphitrite]|uniref:ATP synthase subunit d, mitochondrial-like n=1 Tax=Amphibalanus amphitrite TaxID=1232801 RepID=UPI001C917103|nr:ATP synthase subunit d, mitochondrial-like [Amphibalanus amphitrite]